MLVSTRPSGFLRNAWLGRRKKPQVDGLKIVEFRITGHSLCVAWDSVHVTTLVNYKLNRLHWSNETSGDLFYLYSGNSCVQVKSANTTQPDLCYSSVSTSSSSSSRFLILKEPSYSHLDGMWQRTWLHNKNKDGAHPTNARYWPTNY